MININLYYININNRLVPHMRWVEDDIPPNIAESVHSSMMFFLITRG